MDISELISQLAVYALNVVFAVFILFGGKYLSKWLTRVAKRVMSNNGVDSTIAGFAANIAYVAMLAFVVITALSKLGIPTASFVAMVGAAGLAIGLALQGSLSNFASGVLLVLFHPIKLGDYIEVGGVSGSVTEISVFSTTLITPDRRTITMPNSLILSGPIINYSTSDTRRIDLVISIPYEVDTAVAKKLIEKVVRSDPRIIKDKEITIGVIELAPSSVNLAVRPWVNSADFGATKFDLQESIKGELEASGMAIPLPHLQIKLAETASKIDMLTP